MYRSHSPWPLFACKALGWKLLKPRVIVCTCPGNTKYNLDNMQTNHFYELFRSRSTSSFVPKEHQVENESLSQIQVLEHYCNLNSRFNCNLASFFYFFIQIFIFIYLTSSCSLAEWSHQLAYPKASTALCNFTQTCIQRE